MWELDCEEGWAPKNWCFEVWCWRRLESPLDCKEIQSVHSKGDQSWVFFGRTDAEAETPILWPPHVKSWLIGKDSDAGGLGVGVWGQEEKGTTGWDGWVASLTQWTCIWVNSRSWWWPGGPGMLQFMGSQRVGHDWATELNWSPNSLRAEHQGPLPCTQFQSFYSMQVAKSANQTSWKPAQVSDFTLKSWKQFAEEAFKYHQWISYYFQVSRKDCSIA